MKKPKVMAIIQARMSSTRLPGKVMLPLSDRRLPALWWMIERSTSAFNVDGCVIATTTNYSNDPIERWHRLNFEWAKKRRCTLYRFPGDENDLIARVISAAHSRSADVIVDLTGDCPMIDPLHINHLVNVLLTLGPDKIDYASNVVARTWPDGLDVQVYWLRTLERLQHDFDPPQHCGWNIAQHPEKFSIYNWVALPEMYWPELGLTLDTADDYNFLSELFWRFASDGFEFLPCFKTADVIQYLRTHPDAITNSNVKRKTPEEG